MKSLVAILLLLTAVAAESRSPFLQFYEDLKVRPAVLRTENTFSSSRITGGQAAAPGQFPYQAGLKIKVGNRTGFCGGSLISPQDVLTAAHCCEIAEEVEVILGVTQIHNTNDPNRVSMIVNKASIKIHEAWNNSTLQNDICILQLPNQVELTEFIKVANLPQDDTDNYSGEVVIASGWGRVSDASTTISPDLQFVNLKVITNFLCNVAFLGMIKGSHICTSGAGGKSPCNGDSGGPIVLQESNCCTVVGITSFGRNVCEIGFPAVFTRVSKYISWIQQNMS